MKNPIKKAILLICVQLMYSCISNGKNITGTLEHSEAEDVQSDYLTIHSVYSGTDIIQRIRTRTLDAKTGDVVSQAEFIFPDLNNNAVERTEQIGPSSGFSKGLIQEDNIVIGLYAEGFPANDYYVTDLLYVIHIDKVRGYFIVSITNFQNTETKYLFYSIYYYKNDSYHSIGSITETFEYGSSLEYKIYSFMHNYNNVNNADATNAARMVVDFMNNIMNKYNE